MRPALPLSLLLLSLAGCVGEILDAPFVLSSGLGAARGVSPSPRTTLLVATDAGVVEVQGDGRAELLAAGVDALAVASHRETLYVLTAEGVRHGPMPPPGEAAALGLWPRAGLRDMQAGCGERVHVADAAGLAAWVPATGALSRFGPPLADVRALALDPLAACAGVLVLAGDRVLWVTADAATPLATGLTRPRALSADAWGGVWVVHGEPPVLARLTTAGPDTRARHLGETADLGFGLGDLFHPANAYLVGPGGTLEYARVVPESERIQAPRPPGSPPVLSAPPAPR